MDNIQLSLLAGSLLSLLFSYVPKLNDWFNAQDTTTKRLVMAGSLLVVSVVVFGSACATLNLPFTVSCDKDGAVGLVTTFLSALVANQATFLISPKPTVESIVSK